MFNSGKGAMIIAEDQGLTQISDEGFLDVAVAEVLQGNPQAVQDFLDGREAALKFLMGQVMKETRGRANPAMINQILLDNLGTKVNE
jgi:aspartyl-tRNA(Asn)/glutamyl-tRNA(Gln) amidotransferase subunit B